MTVSRFVAGVCLALYILILSACDGYYQPRRYYGIPYNNTRTAGFGVEYVRANLAPPKALSIETPAPAIPTDIRSAEELFKNFQGKMGSFKLEFLLPKPRYNQ